MLQLVCNSVVSHLQLLCHKSIAKPHRRQEVMRSFCRKNTDFLKHPAFLSQLKRNKEFENVTVVLHFPSKSAECNSYRTFLGTFECVLSCIFLYLYALICIMRFLCTLLWRFAVFPSPLHSHRKQIRASAQYMAQQFLYKKAQKETAVQKCTTASHNSGYAIEIYSGQLITEQPLLPRSA